MTGHRASASPKHETIKVRGLARLAAAIFAGWGGLVAFKGLYDLFVGEPEANLYAPTRWGFVTEAQWLVLPALGAPSSRDGRARAPRARILALRLAPC